MYTTHIKHSWEIQIFHTINTPSGVEHTNGSEVTSFLNQQMNKTDIQARVLGDFERLFANIQLDTTHLDKINDPVQLAQLSLSSTNELFASQARDKFLSLTGGDQSYLDELARIRASYNIEKQALLKTSQFQNQTDAILNPQA